MHDVPFVDAHVHFWDLAHLRYPGSSRPSPMTAPTGRSSASHAPICPATTGPRRRGGTSSARCMSMPGPIPTTRWPRRGGWRGWRPGRACPTPSSPLPTCPTPMSTGCWRVMPNTGGCAASAISSTGIPIRSAAIRRSTCTRTDRWAAGFAPLAHHGLSFDLQCYPAQMIAVARIAQRHPDVPVMVNQSRHAGADRSRRARRLASRHGGAGAVAAGVGQAVGRRLSSAATGTPRWCAGSSPRPSKCSA